MLAAETDLVQQTDAILAALKDARILVVGLGKSGIASALFLKARGARVTVSDAKSEEELAHEIPHLLDHGIIVETGGHGERTFRDEDLIVVSPGVPSQSPQLAQAREAGTPVIGEIELAARFLKGRIVAITGSNGKTTTTTLIGKLIGQGSASPGKSGNRNVLIGGNIGIPAISLVSESSEDTYTILEVSSFQLETIQTFHPYIAVVLNVTPDHLDRHRSFEAYVAAKARIFENQTAGDFAVLNADDATCINMARMTAAQVRWFSRRREVEGGAFVRAGRIFWRDAGGNGERELMPLSEIRLKGAHNVENVLAAVCAGTIAGAPAALVRSAVRDFHAVEHRLEYVATVAGVEYYNDSKATNVDATMKALQSFPANIHLIVGGKHKGSAYTGLKPLLHERAKRIYTVGAAAEIIEQDVQGAAEMVRAHTVENAVRLAAEAATPGDIVLLAPACASFDQFESYEHRGRVFRQAVEQLRAGRE